MNITAERPQQVGDYDILTDFITPGATIRVFRLEGPSEGIREHVHHKSTQMYLSIGGVARVRVDGVDHLLSPYEALTVPAGVPHGAVAIGEFAVLANISVPGLAPSDQLSAEPIAEPPDYHLPVGPEDVDD